MKIKEFKIKSLNGYNISVRTYLPTGNIKEIIISLIVTLISVLNIFWWNENCYF